MKPNGIYGCIESGIVVVWLVWHTDPVNGQLETLDLVLVGVDVHGVGREGLEELVPQLID